MKKYVRILCAVSLLCAIPNIGLTAEDIDFETSISTATQAAKDGDSDTVLTITMDLLKSTQLDDTQISQTYYLRAWVYQKILKDYREAIYYYTQSVDKKADDRWTASSLINRASCYGLLKKFDRALKDVNLALEMWPDNPTALGQKKALLDAMEHEEELAEKGPRIE
ncbi:MAG: tetratricopeptide repeat protein [Candidatus Omnitrophica bacterium]|nr:tetratricopeptide repeat protein [Candidatus Omnitrophota bacterium]